MSDQRDRLERLRDDLRSALDQCEPNVMPQLAAQYRATLADLAQLDAQDTGSSIRDDLKDARDRRKQRQRRATPRKQA